MAEPILAVQVMENRWIEYRNLVLQTQWPSQALTRTEAARWTEYTDACHEHGVCLAPGCWVRTGDRAFCGVHEAGGVDEPSETSAAPGEGDER